MSSLGGELILGRFPSGGDAAETQPSPSEADVTGLVYKILRAAGSGDMRLEQVSAPSGRANLIVAGSEYHVCTVLNGGSVSDDDVATLRNLADSVRENTGRDAKGFLITADVLTDQQISLLRRHGVGYADRRWMLRQAHEAGLAEQAIAVVGTMPGHAWMPRMLVQLRTMPTGRAHWSQYQRFCAEVMRRLFVPPLASPRWERTNGTGTNRRDIVLSNYSPDGFWAYVRQTYQAVMVLADAKNYTAPIDKQAVLDIANYLSDDGLGLFGLALTRKGCDLTAENVRREQWNRFRKMIVVCDDADLATMMIAKAVGDEPERVLRKKLEDFRLQA